MFRTLLTIIIVANTCILANAKDPFKNTPLDLGTWNPIPKGIHTQESRFDDPEPVFLVGGLMVHNDMSVPIVVQLYHPQRLKPDDVFAQWVVQPGARQSLSYQGQSGRFGQDWPIQASTTAGSRAPAKRLDSVSRFSNGNFYLTTGHLFSN